MSERQIVICKLQLGAERWKPELFPGSDEAIAKGCTCPEDQPWPGRFAFATDCTIHELEKLPN